MCVYVCTRTPYVFSTCLAPKRLVRAGSVRALFIWDSSGARPPPSPPFCHPLTCVPCRGGVSLAYRRCRLACWYAQVHATRGGIVAPVRSVTRCAAIMSDSYQWSRLSQPGFDAKQWASSVVGSSEGDGGGGGQCNGQSGRGGGQAHGDQAAAAHPGGRAGAWAHCTCTCIYIDIDT